MSTWDILQYYHSKTDLTLQLHVVLHISKIQLVVYNQCCILIGWAIDSEPIRARGIILLNTYSMYSCIWVHVYLGTSSIQVYRFILYPGEVLKYVAIFLDATHHSYQEMLWSWQPLTRKLHLRKPDWEKPINMYFVLYPVQQRVYEFLRQWQTSTAFSNF